MSSLPGSSSTTVLCGMGNFEIIPELKELPPNVSRDSEGVKLGSLGESWREELVMLEELMGLKRFEEIVESVGVRGGMRMEAEARGLLAFEDDWEISFEPGRNDAINRLATEVRFVSLGVAPMLSTRTGETESRL